MRIHATWITEFRAYNLEIYIEGLHKQQIIQREPQNRLGVRHGSPGTETHSGIPQRRTFFCVERIHEFDLLMCSKPSRKPEEPGLLDRQVLCIVPVLTSSSVNPDFVEHTRGPVKGNFWC